MADRLAGDSVVTMRGDWTLPDPEISEFLASFGRYGIPFNVVFGPGAPDGLPLPEILTIDVVLSALAQASETGRAVAGGSEQRLE